MSQQNGSGFYSSYWGTQGAAGIRAEGRQPGSRRAKLKGYLRAANELRQDIMSNYSTGWDNRDSRLEQMSDGMPGSYPDAAVIQGGDEEMILFPSYARKHIKKKPRSAPASPVLNPGENEYWKQNWEEYEEDNALVDVDVRGWVFSPHKGPMSRKQRFYFSLARQLAGLSSTSAKTPTASQPSSRDSSPRPSHRERMSENIDDHAARREAEAVSKEAERIQEKGEEEAAVAGRGGYSELPQDSADTEPFRRVNSSDQLSRQSTNHQLRHLAARNNSIQSDDESSIKSVQKRASWPQPADMSHDQMSVANAHLLARIKPFLSTPIANAPISAFFYNDEASRQRTIYTNASGHFALRAALDFVPTHVRILASENLSATEKVNITETRGVTVISDIDDTIKHTSMMSGAREAFRNAFIRELADLTIEGVDEWYTRLSKIGVKFHYVSNSPWQLYPTLTKYMSLAGLPPGSVHLKLYSGMLQGIFEPVAERKKSTMDRLVRDFPDRKFILIGDSGEADLEVYTDFVIEHPGKVLAVYIRDVTTPISTGFFDGSTGPLHSDRRSGPRRSAASNSRISSIYASDSSSEQDPDLKAAIEASLRDFELDGKRRRPALPPRPPSDPGAPQRQALQSQIGDLIEFSDDEPTSPLLLPQLPRSLTTPALSPSLGPLTEAEEPHANGLSSLVQKSIPPMPPEKPVALRGSQGSLRSSASHERQPSPAPSTESHEKKRPPPKPRRPSTSVKNHQPRTPSPLAALRSAQAETTPKPENPPPLAKQPSYTSFAKQRISSTYSRLPSAGNSRSSHDVDGPGEYTQAMGSRSGSTALTEPLPRRSRLDGDGSGQAPDEKANRPPPPPPPPRRGISSYPAAAAHYASNRVSSAWNSYNNPSSGQVPMEAASTPGAMSPSISKREEMWRRRWARAEFILRDRGVALRSWRVGGDVADDCLALVEKAMRDMRAGQRYGG